MAGSLTMPQGTPVSDTSAAVRKLEEGAERLRRELLDETGQDYVRHIFAAIGDQPMASGAGGGPPSGPRPDLSASHLGEVTIELAPSEVRAYSSEQLGNRWREMTGPIPEAVDLRFTVSFGPIGDDVDVMLVGPNMDRLRAAADEVKRHLGAYRGVYGITDSFRAGKQEMKLDIKPAAETLGLTLQNLGRQVRQAFYGEEASESSVVVTTSGSWCATRPMSGDPWETSSRCGFARRMVARSRSVRWRLSSRVAGLPRSSESIATARSTSPQPLTRLSHQAAR